ncbi:MAG TPA: OsmC family protein [Devosia sp.]|nr:OsmC family protein [Devosia sp.]
MVTFREKTTRAHGVSAVASVDGTGSVTAMSGGSAVLAVSNTDAGLTPLELLDGALAACLAVSIRYAAKRAGLLEQAGAITVTVEHEKAPDDVARVARFLARYSFAGPIGAGDRDTLIAEGHRLCTVGKTIAQGAEIVDVID